MKEGCKFDATGSRRTKDTAAQPSEAGKGRAAHSAGVPCSPHAEQCVGGCLFIGEVSTGSEFWGVDASLAGQSVKLESVGGGRSGGSRQVLGKSPREGPSSNPMPVTTPKRLVRPHWHQLHGTRLARTARPAQSAAVVRWRCPRAAEAQWELP